MNKWIAEFDLEDGDTMPEYMDLNYMGAKIDFHCRAMWIPVSERLPEDGGNYLVTIVFDIGGKEPVREVRKDYFCNLSKKWLYEEKNVVAWMPLPKPYKEEGAE